ncbi:P-loop containing nucleoside triphosphate hydrolases superfamily protein [Artemisia annua]|uniref:ATP-dependent RNA helicase n=1 Tax=Artemisia annua TaxID=35608 RepID=A0A2U1QFN6_ARTAN|nr:P-loop containing nucleoside triphosphate hydrolases superfamily protein [Artemisia annua]
MPLSSSLPVTLTTMNSVSSSSTIFIPNRLNNNTSYQSISSCNNLGFQRIGPKTDLQFSNSTRFEIRARKGVVEDELSDWVNKRKKFFNESDDMYSDNGGGYSRGRGSRGGGGGRGEGRSGDFNGGYRNSERSGENRGLFGGSSSRGGRGRGGRFGGEFGNRDGNGGRGGRGSSNSMERGRFGGEFGGRDDRFGNGRGGGRGSGSLRGGRGRYGGEMERRDGRFPRDSDRDKGDSWGSYYSKPEGTEPYVRDSSRNDDRFGGRGRGRGGGGGRGRGSGRDVGVRTSVSRTMERGSLVMSEEEDVDDDEVGETELMYNYREVISDEEDIDDVDDEDEDDGVLGLDVEERIPRPPRVPSEGNEAYLSETRFDQCSVSPMSLRGIKDAGYEKMTIVQEATLPVILKGKDVLAKARTGTGKTVAFLLPSIEVVVNSPPVSRDERWPPIVVLVICPTRELASQAATEANKLLKYHPSVGVQVVIGGTRIATEQRRLQTNPCQILVATPGRLKDHIMNTSGFATRVKGVKVLILDEADHLLDMGFRKDIENIIAAVPKQRQTLLFSATVPPEVRQICHIALKRDHEYINTVEEGSEETHTQVQQKHMIAPLDKQFSLLYTLLKDHIADDPDYKVLVFCTTAMVTKLVADILGQLRLNVREIHSRKSQSYRTQVSDEFRKSKGLILVTSDVSARGVDYPDVTLVIQIGLPSDKAQYIHRLGRTGRKGKVGEGILMLAPWEEFFLSTLRDLPISKAEPPVINPDTKKKVEKALSYMDMKIKESAYQAWLGYYNSNKTVAKDKSRLVELANEFSRSMGLNTPPALSKIVLGKMGLKNVPGLRFK